MILFWNTSKSLDSERIYHCSNKNFNGLIPKYNVENLKNVFTLSWENEKVEVQESIVHHACTVLCKKGLKQFFKLKNYYNNTWNMLLMQTTMTLPFQYSLRLTLPFTVHYHSSYRLSRKISSNHIASNSNCRRAVESL